MLPKKQLLIFAVALVCSCPRLMAVTIDTVPIGNPGNAPDTTSYGAVAYAYRLGTTEVTNAQYVEFLNAKAASDPLALYNPDMAGVWGGITRSGSSGSYTYSLIPGRENKPVNYVSWYDAARFINWLNNGQGDANTEDGAYELLGGTPIPTNPTFITRRREATWFFPSENEWYKAAYHKNDGQTGNYFFYPTKSDDPTLAQAPPGGSNAANIEYVVNDLTDVGSYQLSSSPYGTFDQGGNILEFTDTNSGGVTDKHVIIRGGWWGNDSAYLFSINRFGAFQHDELRNLGFRVATVPEPSTSALGVLAASLVLICRRKRRCSG